MDLYERLKHVVTSMYKEGEFDNRPYKFNEHLLRQKAYIGRDEHGILREEWFQESIVHFGKHIHQNTTESIYLDEDGNVSEEWAKKFKCKFNVVDRFGFDNIDGNRPYKDFTLTITMTQKRGENFKLCATIENKTPMQTREFMFIAGRLFFDGKQTGDQIVSDFRNVFLEIPLCFTSRNHQYLGIIDDEEWRRQKKAIENYHGHADNMRLLMAGHLQRLKVPAEITDQHFRPALPSIPNVLRDFAMER